MPAATYPATITTPSQWPLEWSMTSSERLSIIRLLDTLRPAVSLEIGSYRGGSLQALSAFSQHVISVDIDPTVRSRLQGFSQTSRSEPAILWNCCRKLWLNSTRAQVQSDLCLSTAITPPKASGGTSNWS